MCHCMARISNKNDLKYILYTHKSAIDAFDLDIYKQLVGLKQYLAWADII